MLNFCYIKGKKIYKYRHYIYTI